MSKISVIVPVYKVEKYLKRCVDSILNQTFKDFELILVDDGSPDSCPAICDDYASKYNFIYVIHKENGGLSDARNYGIEYALTTDSEWITFIDSDDWIHPQYLEILYDACIYNNVNISCCNNVPVYGIRDFDGEIQYKDYTVYMKHAEELWCVDCVVEAFFTAWGKLYYKELFRQIRFPVGKIFEDEFTIYKLLFSENKIVFVNLSLYAYYQNNSGIMGSSWDYHRFSNRIEAFTNQLYYFYENRFYKAINKRYPWYYNTLIYAIRDNWANKDFKKYIKQQKKNIKFFANKFPNCLDDKQKEEKRYNVFYFGRKERIDEFNKEIADIKLTKNLFYASFYWLKHFWKVYF